MRKKRAAGLAAMLLAFLQGFLFTAVSIQAVSGMVYSCTINRSYAHPVTGEIEDPGGEASYTTGQGMVEGAVCDFGIMEVTDSGEYYLTFRMSLIDYTSNYSFSVQNAGDSGWTAVTPTVTANGSDANGTTSDLCIRVPGENCIVRGSMNVTPMGRDVIFYFYPDNYTEGNSVGMTAAVVTESAAGQAGAAQENQDSGESAGTDNSARPGADNGVQDADRGAPSQSAKEAAPASEEPGAEADNRMAGNDGQAAAPTDDAGSASALSGAQGLSLSTAADIQEETEISSRGTGVGMVELIVVVTASITISGLILMAAAAAIVCYFRKNWRRWGGYDSEEYDEEDE